MDSRSNRTGCTAAVGVGYAAAVDQLNSLSFVNRFTRELPAEPETAIAPRQVYGSVYSRVRPQRVPAPSLVAWSRDLVDELGFDPGVVDTEDFAAVFGGSKVLAGMDPHAMCYGGHQFGHWAGQLGDGLSLIHI